MATYPNQKTITIDKPSSFRNYAIYGSEEMAKACSELNGSGFKVWCYLLKNSSGVKWNISPKDAEINWGIAHSTWRDGINELKEKGFLDDKAIHMISTKDEYRPEDKTKSNQHMDDFRFLNDDNQHRNNISKNIYNTVSAGASADKDNKQEPKERKTYPRMSEAEMNRAFEGDSWLLNTDKNGIWTNPNNPSKKVKVIFADR